MHEPRRPSHERVIMGRRHNSLLGLHGLLQDARAAVKEETGKVRGVPTIELEKLEKGWNNRLATNAEPLPIVPLHLPPPPPAWKRHAENAADADDEIEKKRGKWNSQLCNLPPLFSRAPPVLPPNTEGGDYYSRHAVVEKNVSLWRAKSPPGSLWDSSTTPRIVIGGEKHLRTRIADPVELNCRRQSFLLKKEQRHADRAAAHRYRRQSEEVWNAVHRQRRNSRKKKDLLPPLVPKPPKGTLPEARKPHRASIDERSSSPPSPFNPPDGRNVDSIDRGYVAEDEVAEEEDAVEDLPVETGHATNETRAPQEPADEELQPEPQAGSVNKDEAPLEEYGEDFD